MKKSANSHKMPIVEKWKTFDPEEIMAAGGTSQFAKASGFDLKKLLAIKGETISEQDYLEALKQISRKPL